MAEVTHELFKRKVEVTIALPTKLGKDKNKNPLQSAPLLVFSEHRITFDIEQNLNKEPNTATISIYNLGTANRKILSQKNLLVSISAGYESNFNLIFTGDLNYSKSFKDGTDWVTEIECKDSGRTINHSKVNKSFRGGVKLRNLIKYLIEELNINSSSYTMSLLEEMKEEYTNGKVLSGSAAEALDKILVDNGFEWSIQNGKLQILKFGDVASKTPFIILTPQTGLAGSPEESAPDRKNGPKGYTATSLLQPGLQPGKLVQISSKFINEVIRIKKSQHSGDTHGGDWVTHIDGLKFRK